MTYRVSYHDGWTAIGEGDTTPDITEYYYTEGQALRRAGELVDAGHHHGILVIDDSGHVLSGVRLELRLGLSRAA